MNRLFRLLSLLCLSIGCLFVLHSSQNTLAETNTESKTRLLCLNIGKADAMLLWTNDQVFLIDAGYEHTYSALETAFREFGITHLNGVFLTHAHEDHEGGLSHLANSDIEVDAWYASRIFYDVKASKHPLYLAALQRGDEVTWLQSGHVISVGDDARFEILGPISVDSENENNNSLVMKFASPDGSILFAGDMKEEEEQDLLAKRLITACDFLKAGHHGDNKASSDALLRTVKPRAAFISTSTIQEPDTPARSTLSRLNNAGAQVFISQELQDAALFTFENGNISFEDYQWKTAPARIRGLSLSVDVSKDIAVITNQLSEEVSLSGTMLYSDKGNDIFPLPDITLLPGESYTIGSEKSSVSCDYIANKKRIWHDSKRDVALLYDAYGRILCGTDNGFAE
ncbi:MAG: MBL fold metallo-hydrolase [Clostridia bacterium]|nr:MBL fold metallo-hydrolase [Clostridia bacterium]